MKTLKRSVAVLLSILMLISVFSVTAMTAFAEGSTYTVAGSSAALFGTEWDCANTANDMTDENGDGVFEKTYENVPAGNYEFKVVENYSWDTCYGDNGNNVSFTVGEDNGTVTITIDSSSKTVGYEVKTTTGSDTPATTSDYYVVGEFADLSWDAAEAGKMTKNDDGSYTKTFEGVAVGSYPIKVNNGTWDECYPSGDNWIVNVDTDRSTVIVTLSADKNMDVQIIAPEAQESSSTTAVVTGGYCIVGNINGVDVGDGDAGWQDVVNQIDVDQPLTMDITTDSYVYIKSADCTQWFMFNDYCQDTTGTLYNTSTGAKEKMKVPAGTITFTLVDNGDGTLTLSYTDGVTPPTSQEPSESTADTTPSTPVTPENPALTEANVEFKTDDTVKVIFTLQAAEKCVNGEGSFSYNSEVLQLESFEFLNVTGSYYNTDLHNEVLFNFTDAENPADFTTAKEFVVVTFKALTDDKSIVALTLVELNAVGETDIPLVTDGNIVGEFTLTATTEVVTPTEPTSETEPTSDTTPTDPAAAPKLSVKKKLKAGETTTAKVENAGDNKVTYTSTNTKVATVNKTTGKITALAKGKATIKAKVGDVTVTKKIKVKTNPVLKNGKKKVTNNQTITVKKGQTLTLKVNGKAASIKNKVKNSKKTVAAVTSKKKATNITIKAKKAGTTTLKITINKVKTYTVKIKVK